MSLVLREKRIEKNMTQQEVADFLGIGVRQFQRYESGRAFPSQDTLNKLEDLFGLPQRVLFSSGHQSIPKMYDDFNINT